MYKKCIIPKTGHKIIDKQHEVWLDILSQLINASIDNKISIMNKVFADLVDYTDFHFNYEESVMLKLSFPGYDEHKRLHLEFKERITRLQARFLAADARVEHDLLVEMQDWLIHHISSKDLELTYNEGDDP